MRRGEGVRTLRLEGASGGFVAGERGLSGCEQVEISAAWLNMWVLL